MNIKKYMIAATMGLITTALIGCKTVTEEIYIDEMYQKAYVTMEIYPFDHIEYTETVTKGNYQVVENQLTQYDLRSTSGTHPFVFGFNTIYNVKKDLSAKLKIRDDADAFIAQYNADNNTEYELMPKEYYNMEVGTAVIKTGTNVSVEPFTVSLADVEIPNGYYMLPFTCELNDNSVPMSENRNSVWVAVNYTTKMGAYGDEAILPADYGFTVTNTGTTVNNLQNLYDGFTNTTCTASVRSTASYNAIVTYEFDQPIALNRIAFVRGGSSSFYVTPAYTYDGETASTAMTRLSLSSTSPMYTAALPESDKLVKQVTFTIAGTSSLLATTATLGEIYFLVKQ